jgi:hypothetical protein
MSRLKALPFARQLAIALVLAVAALAPSLVQTTQQPVEASSAKATLRSFLAPVSESEYQGPFTLKGALYDKGIMKVTLCEYGCPFNGTNGEFVLKGKHGKLTGWFETVGDGGSEIGRVVIYGQTGAYEDVTAEGILRVLIDDATGNVATLSQLKVSYY